MVNEDYYTTYKLGRWQNREPFHSAGVQADMKRLRTPFGWLGSAWRPFARRGPAVCERCPWLEFCGRPTLVADAGIAEEDGLHDVIVTFRVVRWLTAPVAKFVIVQTRVRSVDLPPENDFLVRITVPCECARCVVPHQAPATTVVAGVHGTRVSIQSVA